MGWGLQMRSPALSGHVALLLGRCHDGENTKQEFGDLDEVAAAGLIEELVEEDGCVRELGQKALVQLYSKARQLRRFTMLQTPRVPVRYLRRLACAHRAEHEPSKCPPASDDACDEGLLNRCSVAAVLVGIITRCLGYIAQLFGRI
jgi:hypothetical protein